MKVAAIILLIFALPAILQPASAATSLNNVASGLSKLMNAPADVLSKVGNLRAEKLENAVNAAGHILTSPFASKFECSSLYAPAHGTVNVVYTKAVQADILPKAAPKVIIAKATFKCDSGYNLVGDSVFDCVLNPLPGQKPEWIGTTPTCERVCPAFSSPVNAFTSVSNNGNYPSTATFTCSPGTETPKNIPMIYPCFKIDCAGRDGEYSWPAVDFACTGSTTGFNSPDAAQIIATQGDEEDAVIALPDPFTFWGVEYSHLWVDSNGQVVFTNNANFNDDPGYEREPLVDLNFPMASLFHDDLVTYENIQTITTSNYFALAWDAQIYEAPEYPVNFRLYLFTNGKIVFQYVYIGAGERSRGDYATVGIRGATEDQIVQVFYSEPVLRSGLCIEFTPDGASYSYTVADCTETMSDMCVDVSTIQRLNQGPIIGQSIQAKTEPKKALKYCGPAPARCIDGYTTLDKCECIPAKHGQNATCKQVTMEGGASGFACAA